MNVGGVGYQYPGSILLKKKRQKRILSEVGADESGNMRKSGINEEQCAGSKADRRLKKTEERI